MTELVILAILGRGLLHLALRTWVSGPGSLVAGGHGLCGRFRHRKSLWPVPPQKTLPERRRTDARTHTQFVIIYKIFLKILPVLVQGFLKKLIELPVQF
jgi:hypothetical protein